MIKQEMSQLDRIEAKLDSLIQLKDAALKMALPKIPASARATAMRLLAQRAGEGE